MNTSERKMLNGWRACKEAMGWLDETGYSLAQGWQRCKRGDWMLWLAARMGVDRRTLVLAACDCAELARPYWPPDNDRPANALRVARSWARSEGATFDDVRAAARAAVYAAYAVYAATNPAAYAAANAAVYAAYAAGYAAVYAATNAAAYAAAYAAGYAAGCAADTATRDNVLAKCATICRRHWSRLPRGEPSDDT